MSFFAHAYIYESLLRAVQKKKQYWVIRRSLDRLTYHMQEAFRQYGSLEKQNLGTTMTVLVIYEKTYLIWHLGDSRIYRIYDRCERKKRGKKEEGGMMRMTDDHVKGKNMLTRCVGSFGYERPDFRMGTVRNGDAMLLCSDGFRHCVTEQELSDVLRPGQIHGEEQISRRLREIGEACMKRGESDNMSAIYIKAVKQ